MDVCVATQEYRNVSGRSQRKFYMFKNGQFKGEEWRGDWCLLAYLARGESDER